MSGEDEGGENDGMCGARRVIVGLVGPSDPKYADMVLEMWRCSCGSEDLSIPAASVVSLEETGQVPRVTITGSLIDAERRDASAC